MVTGRVRIVPGSCWPCKKRRVKCDLFKPKCRRCSMVGDACSYSTRLIKWSGRPTVAAPAAYQVPPGDDQLNASLAVSEKRAINYFYGRLWPLLTATSQPCDPPVLRTLEHRVVLLATCVVADTHRVLQDGRNGRRVLNIKRLECLSAVRNSVNYYCASGDGQLRVRSGGSLMTLLLAVLLLYFHDGFLECTPDIDSTSMSGHYVGVRAIIEHLGGIYTVLETSDNSLHMLVSEFASADLTTALIKCRAPSFSPEIWDSMDRKAVWWGRDPLGQQSLAPILREMCHLASYLDVSGRTFDKITLEAVRKFEAALRPTYAPLTLATLSALEANAHSVSDSSLEVVHFYALIRAFQHAALIYLYRAVCGLPASHPLVEQHTLPCLDCILEIQQPSKVLNCVTFPLFIAGAHVPDPRYQRKVRNIINVIYNETRFSSVRSVGLALEAIWELNQDGMAWVDVFAELAPDVIVL